MDVHEAISTIKTRARKQPGGCKMLSAARGDKACRCTLCLADWVYEEWAQAHDQVLQLRRELKK
jgi:hypothetical protein